MIAPTQVNKVIFGSFLDPISLDRGISGSNCFIEDNIIRPFSAALPKVTLEHINDLRVAKYSDPEIMDVLNLSFIPPTNLLFELLGRCSRCGLTDHLRPNCKGVCRECVTLGQVCSDCSKKNI